MIRNKKILIGVTGGIAAYKVAFLIRLLVKSGAEVKVLMTPNAKHFVSPLTLSTLSGNPVHSDFYNQQTGVWNNHVELGLWADLFIVVPATANTLGKAAHGMADNLLLTTYLSARCRIMVCPAMDLDMYQHPSTIENISRLEQHGVVVIPPDTGYLASGLSGEGRLPEPETLLEYVRGALIVKPQLAGEKVLISAGSTHEAIDPVRFIGNRSSGRMGMALANAFVSAGAEVTLVKGPTTSDLPILAGVKVLSVENASEMADACLTEFGNCSIAVMAAAVSDYSPQSQSDVKLKKQENGLELHLVKTLDILKEMGNRKEKKQRVIGFALETNNSLEFAKEKLKLKKADAIILNTMEDDGAGFGHHTNKVKVLKSSGEILDLPKMGKDDLAYEIVNSLFGSPTNKTE